MTIPTPSWTSKKLVRYDVEASELAGSFMRKGMNGVKRLVYSLVYRPGQLDTTRAQQLIDQFNVVKGDAQTFTWTPWNSSTPITVRFRSDELNLSVASLVSYGATVDLIKEPY